MVLPQNVDGGNCENDVVLGHKYRERTEKKSPEQLITIVPKGLGQYIITYPVPPPRNSINLDLNLNFSDSSVDSIRAANAREDHEDLGGGGRKLNVDRRGCIGGNSRLWERIKLLEPGSRLW